MFEPAAAAGQNNRGIRRRSGRWRSFPQREGENDEPKRIEEEQQRRQARDHSACRNVASTAARATQVASTVRSRGKRNRKKRSIGPSVAPLASSPAKDAPVVRSSR